ncbi:hypothetical protein OG413_08320 [Streptomyces sp. NBC_01433]|uniref:hypothetical protein n=1 Tax=Streptomyces sp. NBC_01433 TaxID=2903864 RepID=UPI0022587667|nr:hypothetical protein [Streptomyces sp. NBC_01433]MCX4675327.1 hypothetical protein [Streptomyces sp. NBC_01433]
MTARLDDDDDGDREGAPSPGEEVADQERDYWENRRLTQELDDDEAGRRERRRLSMRERKMHLRVRMHRYARQQDQGPLPSALVLPPLPEDGDPYGRHDVTKSDDDWY